MFERFELLSGKDARVSLMNKTVLIVGLGGVGGYVVEGLVRSGIGHIIIIDHDIVDITNKNRQIIALDSTIGMKKIDVIRNRVNDINSDCIVDSLNLFLDNANIEKLDNYKIDYFIDCCDTVTTKKEIIRYCINRKIPFISCMGTGNKWDPSQLEIVNIEETSYDPLARILRKFVKDEEIIDPVMVLCSKEQPISTGSRIVGSTSFVPSSAGLLIASYVIRQFLDIKIGK